MKEKLQTIQKNIETIFKSDKFEIIEILNEYLSYNLSSELKDLIHLNIEISNDLEINDFKFHSILTLQQIMIEISDLSLYEIQKELSKK